MVEWVDRKLWSSSISKNPRAWLRVWQTTEWGPPLIVSWATSILTKDMKEHHSTNYCRTRDDAKRSCLEALEKLDG